MLLFGVERAPGRPLAARAYPLLFRQFRRAIFGIYGVSRLARGRIYRVLHFISLRHAHVEAEVPAGSAHASPFCDCIRVYRA